MPNHDTILTYLQVTAHSRPFLQACYDKIGHHKAEHHAYNNAERFQYGLLLGGDYWRTALQTPLSVKPLLFYYGLNHFMKSCLLTVDPGYPATAKVLAHGLSTRKRKKQHYRFLEDDIRIQPHGLFQHAAHHLFQFSSNKEKVSMDELLRPLPAMDTIYQWKEEKAKEPDENWPELLRYFAVLYNLSMLVRYEGEWWGEMEQMKDREDYVFILHFLETASERIPELISLWMKDQWSSVP
ncbi:YaaC family protein [Halobacillus sp. ACCC02827]|uniref:YaaC family protein n=1 Tax=Halobacillus sp. ACCC02827 TaxID=3052090 RepID=UPI00256FC6D1|nr:YaaC family protein [Halobacillus sp. ACCC02827]WJE15831.1 YaaC family protein [Halobacillus sp. ACCC02827]